MIWLLDALMLYGVVMTVPLLGLGCVIYYLISLYIGFKSRGKPHKGMRERMKRLEMQQKENDRIYQQKELDKVKDHWHNTKHQRLTPLQLVALAALCIVIGWSLKHV